MKRFIEICQCILVLMGLMICGLFLTTLLGSLPIGTPMSFTRQWIIFAGQNILAFIVPALLAWMICFRQKPFKAIEADAFPSMKMIGIAVLIYVVGMPALNQIVFWNQEMHLPDFLESFENWCREMEKLAEQQTEGLLGTTDIFPVIMNILIIGVLTGIGEEFFFRGALQRMLVRCKVNPNLAIWTAAFIFSALHFQFFGFIPRVLLGAFFGYLYWWSGNIWVNAFAHALNNSLVIVSSWCINKGFLSEQFDMVGVDKGGFPFSAALSAIAVAAIIYYLYKSGFIVNKNGTPALTECQINNENASESK